MIKPKNSSQEMVEDFYADRNVTEGEGNEAKGSLKIISKCIHYFF